MLRVHYGQFGSFGPPFQQAQFTISPIRQVLIERTVNAIAQQTDAAITECKEYAARMTAGKSAYKQGCHA